MVLRFPFIAFRVHVTQVHIERTGTFYIRYTLLLYFIFFVVVTILQKSHLMFRTTTQVIKWRLSLQYRTENHRLVIALYDLIFLFLFIYFYTIFIYCLKSYESRTGETWYHICLTCKSSWDRSPHATLLPFLGRWTLL